MLQTRSPFISTRFLNTPGLGCIELILKKTSHGNRMMGLRPDHARIHHGILA